MPIIRIDSTLIDIPGKRKKLIERIMQSALEAVEPDNAVRQSITREGNHLIVCGRGYDLLCYQNVYLIGFGKASWHMVQALRDILADDLTACAVVVKHLPELDEDIAPIILLKGNHPVPGEESLRSTEISVGLLQEISRDDLVIFAISGGGSALFSMPVAGISLSDMQLLTKQLLACGASIGEINTLRKHLDKVKGGGLAKLVYPAEAITLILSDVIGNPLDVIASGPTVPDTTTFDDVWNILHKYDIVGKLPESIEKHFELGRMHIVSDTPKPGDPCFAKVNNFLIGSNYHAAKSAMEMAKVLGFNTLLLTTFLQGEARYVGEMLSGFAQQILETGEPIPKPACLLLGGETTVTIQGAGKGGRNLEVALGAVEGLAKTQDTVLVTFATDGEDGPTDAAGALVSSNTMRLAEDHHLIPYTFLAVNDSYRFFEKAGGLVRTGPTGTNVNDLTFLFVF